MPCPDGAVGMLSFPMRTFFLRRSGHAPDDSRAHHLRLFVGVCPHQAVVLLVVLFRWTLMDARLLRPCELRRPPTRRGLILVPVHVLERQWTRHFLERPRLQTCHQLFWTVTVIILLNPLQ